MQGYKSSRNEDDPTDVSSASDGEEVELDFERKRKLKLDQHQEGKNGGDGITEVPKEPGIGGGGGSDGGAAETAADEETTPPTEAKHFVHLP